MPKLSAAVMLDLERVLDNKPVRPPMISTLAMRWQYPPGADAEIIVAEPGIGLDELAVTATNTRTAKKSSKNDLLSFCTVL